jgi:hypothetical protein
LDVAAIYIAHSETDRKAELELMLSVKLLELRNPALAAWNNRGQEIQTRYDALKLECEAYDVNPELIAQIDTLRDKELADLGDPPSDDVAEEAPSK